MDLPLCKICGERHRLGGCFADPATERRRWLRAMAPVKEIINAPETAAQVPQADQRDQAQAPRQEEKGRPFTPDDMKQESMPVVRPRFDRNAYQRELMRARRAKAKSAQTSGQCSARQT
jgi:hypothetical protein